MKRFPLLLPLVAVVFAVACTDSTAPANSHALLSPTSPAFGFRGNPPPPPVDAAITITVSSPTTISGPFDGRYFSNGKTAWLQLDNSQSAMFETSASANARFKSSGDGDKMSGKGTLMIEGHEVVITDVTSFFASPDCGTPGAACAVITFNATVDGEPGHTGTAQAFDREFCTFIPFEGGGGFYSCGD